MSNLSPASQAVLDAVEDDCIHPNDKHKLAAAALRAAADQVTPENYKCFTGASDWDLGSEARNDAIRDELLAITAELEGVQ